MSLTSAMNKATSGLAATQSQLSTIAGNIANANTVGYTKRVNLTNEIGANSANSGGVRANELSRVTDSFAKRQLRTEASNAASASSKASYLSRLDQLYGDPASQTGLSAMFTNFTSSLQQLVSDPSSVTGRQNVLSNAQSLTASLNDISNNIQGMRAEIDDQIKNQTSDVNNLLGEIFRTTNQLQSSHDQESEMSLLDQRDQAIDKLSNYMDIRVLDTGNNNLRIFTNNGIVLFEGGQNLKVSAQDSSSVSAKTLFDKNPNLSQLGSITIADKAGGSIDIMRSNGLKSGSLSALFDLRDKVLVEAQNQLDELAASFASSLGDTTTSGVAATSGAQQGFTLDLNGIQSGNVISLETTLQPAGTKQKFSFIAVNNSSALPLSSGATPDPNDIEVGIDFSGGISSAITAIGAALGAPYNVSDAGGGVMQILDDGAGNLRDVNNLSTQKSATSLSNGGTAFPFFVDASTGNTPYTGSFDQGSQKRGFAGNIRVNPTLLNDTSKLVVYQTTPSTTLNGDTARPLFLLNQLQSKQADFSPSPILTGSNASFRGTSLQFMNRMITTQTQATAVAQTVSNSQDAVLNTIKERNAAVSGVNTDEELANSIQINNNYMANMQLLKIARDMMDTLLRM